MSENDLHDVHVLVVEDTADTRDLLREALQYCGAFVTTAGSAKEAETLLRDRQPHVIVTDLAMPDDGVALLHHVMELNAARGMDIPVIAISSHHHRPQDLRRAGFVEFVPKPFDPIALCATIRAHARRRH